MSGEDGSMIAAEIRLARASDAWLAHDEVRPQIVAEYADAFDEVMRLRGSDKRFTRRSAGEVT